MIQQFFLQQYTIIHIPPPLQARSSLPPPSLSLSPNPFFPSFPFPFTSLILLFNTSHFLPSLLPLFTSLLPIFTSSLLHCLQHPPPPFSHVYYSPLPLSSPPSSTLISPTLYHQHNKHPPSPNLLSSHSPPPSPFAPIPHLPPPLELQHQPSHIDPNAQLESMTTIFLFSLLLLKMAIFFFFRPPPLFSLSSFFSLLSFPRHTFYPPLFFSIPNPYVAFLLLHITHV